MHLIPGLTVLDIFKINLQGNTWTQGEIAIERNMTYCSKHWAKRNKLS